MTVLPATLTALSISVPPAPGDAVVAPAVCRSTEHDADAMAGPFSMPPAAAAVFHAVRRRQRYGETIAVQRRYSMRGRLAAAVENDATEHAAAQFARRAEMQKVVAHRGSVLRQQSRAASLSQVQKKRAAFIRRLPRSSFLRRSFSRLHAYFLAYAAAKSRHVATPVPLAFAVARCCAFAVHHAQCWFRPGSLEPESWRCGRRGMRCAAAAYM